MAVGDSKAIRIRLTGHFQMFTRWLPASLSMLIPPAKTGADGRFQLRGAGRERIVSLLIQGPKIQTRVLQVMTRVGPSNSIQFPRPQPGQMALNTDILIYAIGFEHVAAPGRDVEGDVVDAATGQPVPGVVIRPRMITTTVHSRIPIRSSDGGRTCRYEPRLTRAGITVWAACPWAIRSSSARSSATECLIDPCTRNYPTRRASGPPGSTSNSCAEFRCRERSRTERPASPSRPSSNTFPRSRIRT